MTDTGTPAPAGQAEPAAQRTSNAASAALTSGWARLDGGGRTIVAGSLALAVIAIAGAVTGAWSLRGLGLLVLVGAIVALVVAWAAATMGPRTWPIAPGFIEVGALLVAADLALLNVFELVADLDDLGDFGGTVGAVLAIALAIVGVAVLVAAARRARLLSVAAWLSPASVRFAAIGGVLVFVGVALGLLIGIVALGQSTAYTVGATLLALVAVRAAADPDATQLPFKAGFLAIGLAVIAIVFALDLLNGYIGSRSVGATDWLFFLIHLAGLALVTYGALLSAGIRIPVSQAAPPSSPSQP